MANEKTMTETSTKDIEATEAIEVPARHRWRLITQKHQLLSRRLRSLLLICFGIFSFFFVGALWSTWILWTSGACQGLSCLGCDRASGGVCRSFNLKHGPTTGAQSPWFDELRQSHEGGTATGPSLPPLTTSAFSESSDTNQLSLNHIPSYVLRHAPLIHLYSQEEFWPCDMAEHLHHVTPFLDYDPAPEAAQHVNLSNLYQLNRFGRDVFLQSKDNVEDRPAWLLGRRNIPKEDDDSEDGNYRYSNLRRCQQIIAQALTKLTSPLRSLTRYITRARGGRSTAPAILIVVPKPDGIVDAFWFFFYSYNLGNQVLNVRFGNHVGDWEHTLVRFHHGKPKAVYFSEHNFGAAYSWEAVEKIGKRPVGYSGTGTHAMYGTAGVHRYVLPWGLLADHTDRGPLWDPALNAHIYTYYPQGLASLNNTSPSSTAQQPFQSPSTTPQTLPLTNDSLKTTAFDALLPSQITPSSPIGWFYFAGHWGDKAYPLEDSRQYQVWGQLHYENGPLGPRFKNLGRHTVCQGEEGEKGGCEIRETRDGEWDRGVPRMWPGPLPTVNDTLGR